MKRITLLIALVAFAAGAAASDLEESKPLAQSGGVREKIVNGLTTVVFPSVVDLLDSNLGFCTGTLIGCETVLTAAHCVCDSTGTDCEAGEPDLTPAGSIEVFTQHGGFHSVSSVAVPVNYVFGSAGDIAVLRLTTPVDGISPTPINTGMSPGPGVAGTITGFGLTDGNGDDSGIKRTGQITSAACSGVPEGAHVCWSFELPLGPAGEDSNTCIGDSGGPLFMNLGGGTTVAGVTSGGFSVDCQPTDRSFDTDVFVERTWVQGQGGADLDNTRCGDLAQAGTASAVINFGEGTLDGANTQDFWSLTVPNGTVELRFVLNGEDSRDFDLYVKQGSQPTTGDFDCRSIRGGPFESCIVVAPMAGTWHILVDRFSGNGDYQIVVTPYGAEPSIFEDGFESGNVSAWSSSVP